MNETIPVLNNHYMPRHKKEGKSSEYEQHRNFKKLLQCIYMTALIRENIVLICDVFPNRKLNCT